LFTVLFCVILYAINNFHAVLVTQLVGGMGKCRREAPDMRNPGSTPEIRLKIFTQNRAFWYVLGQKMRLSRTVRSVTLVQSLAQRSLLAVRDVALSRSSRPTSTTFR